MFRRIGQMPAHPPGRRPPPGLLTTFGWVLVTDGGRFVWSTRFAPP